LGQGGAEVIENSITQYLIGVVRYYAWLFVLIERGFNDQLIFLPSYCIFT